MNRLLLALFLTVSVIGNLSKLHGQNVASVKWGPELKGYKTGSVYPFGFDESGYYIVSANMFDYFFQKIDPGLNRVAKTKFIAKSKSPKRTYKPEGSIRFNRTLLLFKSSYNSKEKKKSLFADSLSAATLLQTGTSKLLTEYEYDNFNNKGNFWLDTSANGQLLLIVSDLPGTKAENARFNIVVYDSSLEKLWEKQVELNVNEKLLEVKEFFISDNGNIFINGKKFINKKRDHLYLEQNYEQAIFALYNKGNILKEFNVNIGEPFFNSTAIRINSKEQITCAGLYSRKNRISVDGFFYCIYDSSQSAPLTKSVKEFDIKTLTDALTEREQTKIEKSEAKGKDNEMPQYKLKDLLLDENGGCTLIAEQEFTETRIVYYGVGLTTILYYCNNDILVVKGDSLGNITWTAKVPKKQSSSRFRGHYSSFFRVVTDSALYFIYNDHRGNALTPKKASNKKEFSLSDEFGAVSIVKITNSGEVSKKDLYNLSETRVYLRPRSCRQISGNTLLIFGEKEKLEQYAIVTLAE